VSIFSKKMEELIRDNPSIGMLGGAGGAGLQSTAANVMFDHGRALAMRMRWGSCEDTPFERVHLHVVHGRKVFITVITKDLKAVTLDVEDDALYPSDHLIAELRTLGG